LHLAKIPSDLIEEKIKVKARHRAKKWQRWFGLWKRVGRTTLAGIEHYNPRMSFLRFLMLLALVVWIGGLIFFAFVVAPTAFSGILPTRHMAGTFVGRSLDALHWMGIVSAVVFLASSMLYSRMTVGSARPMAARHLLIVLMLVLTVISQFAISPRMQTLRAEAGTIDNFPLDSPLRVEFNRLHVWSEKFEEAVFLLGLGALFSTARALK
jgi:uncharacterized membrane protein